VLVEFVSAGRVHTSADFELNNALNLTKVSDETGRQVSLRARRRISGERELCPATGKGQTGQPGFRIQRAAHRGGRLSGVRHQVCRDPAGLRLLLYPARWFPVAGYSTNRHTMDMRITVPSLYKVIAPGIERRETLAGDKVAYSFQFTQPAFPGSLAIVQGDPVQASSEACDWMYFHDAEKAMTAPYARDRQGDVLLDQPLRPAPQAN